MARAASPHGHDLARHDNDELGASRQPQLAGSGAIRLRRRTARSVAVGRDEYCVFAMQTGKSPAATGFEVLNCALDSGVARDVGGAIHFLRDRS